MPSFERPRPPVLLRFVFRLPPLLYHGPLARFLASRCVIRLTTTGRRSGKPRTVCVSAMGIDSDYVVFSGFGIDSNWYRNLLADPHATIRIGPATMPVTAAVVPDPFERQRLMLLMQKQSSQCGPPARLRPLLSALRAFDYDAEIAMAVENATILPVVKLSPTQ